MISRGAFILAVLCCASSASAQRLYPGSYEGQTLDEPQLHESPSRAPKIIGIALLVAGGAAVLAEVPLFAAETSYRLRYRTAVTEGDLDSFRCLQMGTFWLGFWGSASLISGMALALPDMDSNLLPVLSGLVGVGLAAVGLGYWVGGTHCGPLATPPGAAYDRNCLALTSSSNFGPGMAELGLVFMAPFVIKSLRAELAPTVHLTLGPNGLYMRGSF